MMSSNRIWTTAVAGVLALAVLTGCGAEPSVASKSAAAFQQAQKEGKTFEGAGHEHGGHGGHEMPEAAPAETGGHQHGESQEADHSAMGHGEEHPAEEHGGHGSHAGAPAATGHEHSGHSQPAAQGHQGHGQAAPQPANRANQGHEGHGQGHEGHGNAAAPQPVAPAQDHAGHAPSSPVAELPAEPASILRPDTLDAPAATSVADAQRSEEMSQSMSGGHGGHGTSTYRQVDAGRGPDAHEGSEPQTPGAGHEHHDHGAATGESAAVYVCPMHPEVTSNAPGTCPKCGMALVERREE